MTSEPLVIVTGAAGWLGRRLVDVLANGLPGHPELERARRVRALVLPGEETVGSDTVEVVRGDLRERATCDALLAGARGATLYHTAGVIHPRRVRDFFSINVEGARTLLDAAAEAGVRRAVMVSSNSPVGANPSPEHRFDEDSPYHPYLGYGRSKMQMELVAREAHARGRLETVLIRPPWFYGPYQPPRQTLFFEMIRDGKGPVVGGGENRRSMAYLDNLCQGLLLAAMTPRAAGRTYWIADDEPYTMNRVLDTVERLLEGEFGIPCAHRRLRLPGLASKVAYLMDATLQSLGLYHQKLHVLSEMNQTIACSIERAKAELGYRPDVALEEGMRRSLAWCIDQGLLTRGSR